MRFAISRPSRFLATVRVNGGNVTIANNSDSLAEVLLICYAYWQANRLNHTDWFELIIAPELDYMELNAEIERLKQTPPEVKHGPATALTPIDFTKLPIGTAVKCCNYGLGVIDAFGISKHFPVRVKLKSGLASYTNLGCLHEDNDPQTLFVLGDPQLIKFVEDLPKSLADAYNKPVLPDLAVDHPVYVKNKVVRDKWQRRHFHSWDPQSGVMRVFADGQSSFTATGVKEVSEQLLVGVLDWSLTDPTETDGKITKTL